MRGAMRCRCGRSGVGFIGETWFSKPCTASTQACSPLAVPKLLEIRRTLTRGARPGGAASRIPVEQLAAPRPPPLNRTPRRLLSLPYLMNIHEYQARELFENFGVATSKGHVALTADEALAVAKGLGSSQ